MAQTRDERQTSDTADAQREQCAKLTARVDIALAESAYRKLAERSTRAALAVARAKIRLAAADDKLSKALARARRIEMQQAGALADYRKALSAR